MNMIEIDFEVFKALTARRSSEAVSNNDVLRQLLGLGSKKALPLERVPPGTGQRPWISKGITFPSGTEFRAKHKGVDYTARIADGMFVYDGKTYESPSAAAVAVTGNSVNGWKFWECRLPGANAWQLIANLRR